MRTLCYFQLLVYCAIYLQSMVATPCCDVSERHSLLLHDLTTQLNEAHTAQGAARGQLIRGNRAEMVPTILWEISAHGDLIALVGTRPTLELPEASDLKGHKANTAEHRQHELLLFDAAARDMLQRSQKQI